MSKKKSRWDLEVRAVCQKGSTKRCDLKIDSLVTNKTGAMNKTDELGLKVHLQQETNENIPAAEDVKSCLSQWSSESEDAIHISSCNDSVHSSLANEALMERSGAEQLKKCRPVLEDKMMSNTLDSLSKATDEECMVYDKNNADIRSERNKAMSYTEELVNPSKKPITRKLQWLTKDQKVELVRYK